MLGVTALTRIHYNGGQSQMPGSRDNPEQVLASERFAPQLAMQYEARYSALIRRLGESLPANRVEIIRNEITESAMGENQNLLDLWKYQAALNVLVDLSQQGWVFDIQGTTLDRKSVV